MATRSRRQKKKARRRGADTPRLGASRVAASVHLDRPGSWTQRGAKAIAKWLRERAAEIECAETRGQMNDTGRFRARYLVKA